MNALNQYRPFVGSIRIENKLPKSSYLNKIPAIKYLENNELVFDSPITLLIGENGTGKSTIIEGIAVGVGFNAEGGPKSYTFKTKDTHSKLHEYLTIAKTNYFKRGYFLRAESFYNVLIYSDDIFGRTEDWSIHAQSHGESFLNTAKNEFSGNNLFILDEPEAALSPNKLMSLICIIHEAVLNNAQFIIATHSPILMSYPNATIYELSRKGINKVNYKETEHYKITKDFFDKPEVMYEHLFKK